MGERESAKTVYVSNLPWHITEDSLVRVFGQFGEVVQARVVQDRQTGRSQGYGFVELGSHDEVEAVCARLDGAQLDGRQLAVRPAQPRADGG
jgi:RNA recognition motif-containing protein